MLINCSLINGSSPLVGSSIMSNSALCDNANAKAYFIFIPLDNVPIVCSCCKENLSKYRSEEHTSELQSRFDLVCRLLLEKKKNDQRSGVADTHEADVGRCIRNCCREY